MNSVRQKNIYIQNVTHSNNDSRFTEQQTAQIETRPRYMKYMLAYLMYVSIMMSVEWTVSIMHIYMKFQWGWAIWNYHRSRRIRYDEKFRLRDNSDGTAFPPLKVSTLSGTMSACVLSLYHPTCWRNLGIYNERFLSNAKLIFVANRAPTSASKPFNNIFQRQSNYYSVSWVQGSRGFTFGFPVEQ